MPKLRVADDEALNAFATGLNDKQYSITVTRGLIDALNDQEIESVLGHELTHIRNGDVRMLVIAVVIAGVISFFGELVFRIFFQNVFWGGGRRSSGGATKRAAPASPSSSRWRSSRWSGFCRSSSASRCRASANTSPIPARSS